MTTTEVQEAVSNCHYFNKCATLSTERKYHLNNPNKGQAMKKKTEQPRFQGWSKYGPEEWELEKMREDYEFDDSDLDEPAEDEPGFTEVDCEELCDLESTAEVLEEYDEQANDSEAVSSLARRLTHSRCPYCNCDLPNQMIRPQVIIIKQEWPEISLLDPEVQDFLRKIIKSPVGSAISSVAEHPIETAAIAYLINGLYKERNNDR